MDNFNIQTDLNISFLYYEDLYNYMIEKDIETINCFLCDGNDCFCFISYTVDEVLQLAISNPYY